MDAAEQAAADQFPLRHLFSQWQRGKAGLSAGRGFGFSPAGRHAAHTAEISERDKRARVLQHHPG